MRPARASSRRPAQAGRTGAGSGSCAPVKRTFLDKQSDSGAMQILANTAKHVDAVPDFVERMRNEILSPCPASARESRGYRFQLSDQNVDRGETCWGSSRATGRVVSAFRRVASR
jgi:hypothetical protein